MSDASGPNTSGETLGTTDYGAFDFVVSESEEGMRLDRALVAYCETWSRTEYQGWIREGRVRVDGECVASKTKLRLGQVVHVNPAPPPPSTLEPENLPLSILYEDAHLLLVDKEAGMVVHPAPGHSSGTLVHGVLYHLGKAPSGDPMRPGIVHRLDRYTSGVMVVAKSREAREGLVGQFSAHSIERSYLAIAMGHTAPQLSWDSFHGRHPRDRKRFSSKLASGKRAVTHVERVRTLYGTTLIRCRLETGRTHQIRVHCSDNGHPLLGDPTYGRRVRDPRLKAIADALGRQALHAATLAFEHPVTGEELRFSSEPPSDFEQALSAIEELG